MKALVYANAPVIPTGFGVVVKEIFSRLLQWGVLEDAYIFGINYPGDPHFTDYKIWPAQVAQTRDPDLYGRRRFMQMVAGGMWDFDVLYILEDHFTVSWPIGPNGEQFMPTLLRVLREQVKQGQRKPFRVIEYVPIDCDFVRPEWINWMPELIDVPVAYTEYGKRVMERICPDFARKLRVIPHGTSPDQFFPIPPAERDQFRRDVLKVSPATPVLINVNRNQPRKDVPAAMCVLRDVRKKYGDARLICHMNLMDPAGFNLPNVRENLGLPVDSVLFPGNFSEGIGIPVSDLNRLYNAADVFITTSRGEGWGLPVTEAMCAGTPVVATDHTSHSEILADGRGSLVPSTNVSVLMQDCDMPRPVADVPAMAEAVVKLLDPSARHTRRLQVEKARAWAEQHTWEKHVVPQWAAIFRGEEEKKEPTLRVVPARQAPSPEWPQGANEAFRFRFGAEP